MTWNPSFNASRPVLLSDAIKAVNVHQGDGDAAIHTMLQNGAIPITVGMMDGVKST